MPDFIAELLVALINFHAEPGRIQGGAALSRVCKVALGDWKDRDLHRREPRGERSTVVLHQNPEEPFERARERAVDHHRRTVVTVRRAVFEFEAVREYEIDLHGSELPLPPDRIAHVDIEFRAVKRSAGFVNLVGQIVPF